LKRSLTVLVAVLAVLALPAGAAATRYIVTPVGPPVVGFPSGPWGMNDAGWIAGQGANGRELPFVWDGTHVTGIPLLAGADFGLAWAVNARGWVVGQDYVFPSGWDGFLWHDGSLVDLPGIAEDVNDKGQVVGLSNDTGAGYVWQDGAVTDLPDTSTADSSNDVGQIAGEDGDYRSFFIRDADGTKHTIANVDGSCGGTPWALNDRGTFVGESYCNGTLGVVGTVLGVTVIPSPSGGEDTFSNPHPWDINDKGEIVGDSGPYPAWLIDAAGTMHNLNDELIPTADITQALGAYAINEKGANRSDRRRPRRSAGRAPRPRAAAHDHRGRSERQRRRRRAGRLHGHAGEPGAGAGDPDVSASSARSAGARRSTSPRSTS
jgi:probable HAF family extracellular repeat protein